MTEPTGERFQTSPELGFAFGRVPIKTVLECLTSPELRDVQEAGTVAEGLELVGRYFEAGSGSDVWESYVGVAKEARKAATNWALPKEVHEKYQEINEIIYDAHLRYVDEEQLAINSFLAHYPGVVTKDAAGHISLVSIESLNIAPDSLGQSSKNVPVQQFAEWSDQTKLEISEPTQLFIDMTALPDSFSKYLNQYRTLYDIHLGTL